MEVKPQIRCATVFLRIFKYFNFCRVLLVNNNAISMLNNIYKVIYFLASSLYFIFNSFSIDIEECTFLQYICRLCLWEFKMLLEWIWWQRWIKSDKYFALKWNNYQVNSSYKLISLGSIFFFNLCFLNSPAFLYLCPYVSTTSQQSLYSGPTLHACAGIHHSNCLWVTQ